MSKAIAKAVTDMLALFGRDASPVVVRQYQDALDGYREESVLAAIGEAKKRERFCPTPAVLRKYAANVERDRRDEGRFPRRTFDPTEQRKTLVGRTRDALAAGHRFPCEVCHGGGFVYVRRDRLPEGGRPDTPPLGRRGIRFDAGMAYPSTQYPELVTLHCICRTVPHASSPLRQQAVFADLGFLAEEVTSYWQKWQDEEEFAL